MGQSGLWWDVGGLATQSGRCFGRATVIAEATCWVCLGWLVVRAEVSHCVWFLGKVSCTWWGWPPLVLCLAPFGNDCFMSKFGWHVLQVCIPLKEDWARMSGFGQGGISGECQGWVNSDSQVDGEWQTWCLPALVQTGGRRAKQKKRRSYGASESPKRVPRDHAYPALIGMSVLIEFLPIWPRCFWSCCCGVSLCMNHLKAVSQSSMVLHLSWI